MREQGLLGDDACMLDIVARLVGASWGVRARVCTDFFHRTTKALPPRSGLLNWKAPGTPEPHVFFPKQTTKCILLKAGYGAVWMPKHIWLSTQLARWWACATSRNADAAVCSACGLALFFVDSALPVAFCYVRHNSMTLFLPWRPLQNALRAGGLPCAGAAGNAGGRDCSAVHWRHLQVRGANYS